MSIEVVRAAAMLATVIGLAWCVPEASAVGPEVRVVDRRVVMGTPATIQVYAPDEATGYEATRAAFARMAEIENALSDYRPRSESTKPFRCPRTLRRP